MDETYDPKEWLRASCVHEWRLGPLTDFLVRHRPALCIKCWEYRARLREQQWRDTSGGHSWPTWTEADYEQHKDEIERRFFGAGSKE
jgi:hypothetical protein